VIVNQEVTPQVFQTEAHQLYKQFNALPLEIQYFNRTRGTQFSEEQLKTLHSHLSKQKNYS